MVEKLKNSSSSYSIQTAENKVTGMTNRLKQRYDDTVATENETYDQNQALFILQSSDTIAELTALLFCGISRHN